MILAGFTSHDVVGNHSWYTRMFSAEQTDGKTDGSWFNFKPKSYYIELLKTCVRNEQQESLLSEMLLDARAQSDSDDFQQ
jgi:hypothetical protein